MFFGGRWQGAQASGLSGGQPPPGTQGGLGGAVRPALPGTGTPAGASADRFGLLGLLNVIQMTNPALWSNAALCHLALRDHLGCVEASTQALELLVQQPGTGPTQAKAYLRRGASRVEIKELLGALADFESALRLLPGDKTIQADCNKVKARLRRHEADRHYKARELELAEDLYSQAIELDPAETTKARSNRTACLLLLTRYAECIEEATKCIEALGGEGEEKARVQALVRRGAAHAKLGAYACGVEDYKEALGLKEDSKVRLDMENMENEMAQ